MRESINWEDDDGALRSLLDQCRENGQRQFRGGAAVIPRAEIDRLNSLPMVNGVFSYERNALATNPYHGNILLRADLHAHTKRRMAAGLALLVSAVVARSDA